MSLLDRFTLDGANQGLAEAIRDQQMVHGDLTLASALATVVRLQEYAPGAALDLQGSPETDLYFLLMGEVSILVNGQEVARRRAGQHVGEMALIDKSARRSATMIAREPVVAAKISEPDFSAIAQKNPYLWKRIAVELGSRLRERSRFIRQKNDTPIVFIGSSTESLPIVQSILHAGKDLPYILRPWTGGVFSASSFAIDDLAAQVTACDFAVLVLGPDDVVISRGIESTAPRDNVILELGLFMGALDRSRTYLVVPRDVDVKIPTDLMGLTPIKFSQDRPAESMAQVCSEITRAVNRLGAR